MDCIRKGQYSGDTCERWQSYPTKYRNFIEGEAIAYLAVQFMTLGTGAMLNASDIFHGIRFIFSSNQNL